MRDRNQALTASGIDALAWDRMGGLLPAIVQDAATGQVLMLGYMNKEALKRTLDGGFVTFFSRSRAALWEKGETSGNRLALTEVRIDCDSDALLVTARPQGPTCHLGTQSCFGDTLLPAPSWLATLSAVVAERRRSGIEGSYTARLFAEGRMRIAQKVGEEGVELALAAAAGSEEACVEEAADLLFHLAVLMEERGFGWAAVVGRLQARHAERTISPSPAG